MSVTSLSRSAVVAILRRSSVSMKLTKSLSGSIVMFSLSVSSSGHRSGLLDSESDNIILSPGRWMSWMLYPESRRDHLACRLVSL